jgi:hypothetical protein
MSRKGFVKKKRAVENYGLLRYCAAQAADWEGS